jgi:4-amino-4-deoxy-L-arabinose transferase-like glycosyltransferase
MADATQPGKAPGKDSILTHPVAFATAIVGLWVLSGLVGHEPWRSDEAHHFGVVYQMLQSGDWVVPMLAGEPYVRNPPLEVMTSALLATLLQPVMPLHDGARLATGLYMGLTLLFVGAAGRELLGRGQGWLAPLSLLGSVGLLLPAHFIVPDIPQLAGVALALFGWALALSRPAWYGGLALGTGLGIAFLAKGFFGPICLLLTAGLLPVAHSAWRTRRYAVVLLLAALAALPWFAIWPALFHQRAPDLFHTWLWTDNFGRVVSDDPPWPPDRPGYYLAILPWFAFPTLPLALWGIWSERSRWREPRIALPLVLTVSLLGVLSISDTARDVLALPVLVPLSLLAVVGLLHLPRSPSNAFWWFSMLFMSGLVLMTWFEWTALEIGVPAARHRHWLRLQPNYAPHVDAFVVAAALALTAFWFWFLARARRGAERPLTVWATGVAVVWAMAAAMFMRYVDADKTYRPVMLDLARALPPGHHCVSSHNLGDTQRAMLHYYAGALTYREGIPGRSRHCDVLLVQGAPANMYVPGQEWTQIWEGARVGERRELFRLYRRIGPPA